VQQPCSYAVLLQESAASIAITVWLPMLGKKCE
jgi:hypothetical protein